jgi:DNA-binding SARP family transcriptional activator
MQALIGFLVLGGDAPQSREQVAFSLWPDSSEAQAKTNLRKALHGLRQIPGVDELIDVSPRSLRWRRELTDAIDVDAFESALEASASAGNGDDAINELARAKQLYTGQLLIDCWDEWLMDHRSRLAELHVSGLRKLAQALAAAGRVEEAARVGQEVVRDEPLQESSYRLLMDLYRASGDRAAAARVYHQCVRTLREELGVPPSDETTAAYRDLTDTQPEPTDALTRAGESKGALVGRKTEWDTLTSLWHDPGTGIARLVLVTGEPGIGKTH